MSPLEKPWDAIVVFNIILAIRLDERKSEWMPCFNARFEVWEKGLLGLKSPAEHLKFCSNMC